MSVKIVSFNDSVSNSDSNTNPNFDNLEDYDNLEEDNIQFNIENDDEIYNNQNTFQNTFQNQFNYNKPNSRTKIKRDPNAISYDDILNSLGFGVNNNGLYKKNTAQQSNFQTIHQPIQQIQQPTHTQNQTLDPRVKNSAIYNKYFKNYKDPNEEIQPIIPLTPQQFRIKLIKEHIERQKAKKRIEQIKSKKLFYTSPNLNARPQQIQIQQPVNLNRLFMFSNRK
jgi:hypothetical protein